MKTIRSTLAAAAATFALLAGTTPAHAQATPTIGQVSLFGTTWCPAGWGQANGATLSIAENEALFSLIGTIYGGDGQVTFKLPDLRGRVPLNADGTNWRTGQMGGQEETTLIISELPVHSHTGVMRAATAAPNSNTPSNAALTDLPDSLQAYTDQAPDVQMAVGSALISATGGSQPFSNVQPVLAMNWCVALFGIYPARN